MMLKICVLLENMDDILFRCDDVEPFYFSSSSLKQSHRLETPQGYTERKQRDLEVLGEGQHRQRNFRLPPNQYPGISQTSIQQEEVAKGGSLLPEVEPEML